MHTNVTTYTYWALWGTYLDQPGEYIVQAYWPGDPNPDDEWQPASNARYTLHFYENGNLRTETLYGNQTLNANEFTTLCKVPYQQSGCPEEQKDAFLRCCSLGAGSATHPYPDFYTNVNSYTHRDANTSARSRCAWVLSKWHHGFLLQ